MDQADMRWDRTSKAKVELDRTNGSLQKLLLAMRYNRVTKDTFKIVVVSPYDQQRV
jgi:hypothetical protein